MTIVTTTLDSGLILVAEQIPNVASVAVKWLAPAGSAMDPDDGDGQSALLSELLFRGAGARDSRDFSDALDRLGVDRSSRCETHHIAIEATLVGDRLADAWPLIVDLVREPHLGDASVEAVRRLALQSLDALEDDPQHLVMLRLHERHLPAPFNRSGYGQREVVEQLSGATLRSAWQQRGGPGGTIISVAGAIDPEAVCRQLELLTRGWKGESPSGPTSRSAAGGYLAIEQDTSQMHIGVAYDAPPGPDPDSMTERVATAVLSGSTSGRLFTEVRQKRSLCYSVGASYRTGRDRGVVSLYAGTTPPRAQETLDVCIAEIERLAKGARRDEFDRAVIGLKSSLVMQGESTDARARALGQDHFKLGAARTLDEIAAAVDAVTFERLNAYLAERRFGPFTLVSIGPGGLTPPSPASPASDSLVEDALRS